MAITNDGSNYFTGNQLDGVNLSVAQTDINSILTSLGLSFQTQNRVFAFRPNGDTLTGTIALPTEQINIGSNISDQARLAFSLFGTDIGNGNTSAIFLLNSSTSNTEVTVRGATTGISISNLDINFSTANGTKIWGVFTNKSVSLFFYRNANYYLFESVGVVDNPGQILTSPETIYGMYSGKYNGGKIQSFRGITPNSTTALGFLNSGALNTQALSANYPHLVVSGISGNVSQFGLRRSDNDYMIGTIPNIMKMKANLSYSYNIGDNIQLNNLNNTNTSLIDGSTENIFKVVGRLDSITTNDNLGDYLLMRIKKA